MNEDLILVTIRFDNRYVPLVTPIQPKNSNIAPPPARRNDPKAIKFTLPVNIKTKKMMSPLIEETTKASSIA